MLPTCRSLVRYSECSARFRGIELQPHTLNYLPSQLPASPTAHEYLSFPLLLCLTDKGS